MGRLALGFHLRYTRSLVDSLAVGRQVWQGHVVNSMIIMFRFRCSKREINHASQGKGIHMQAQILHAAPNDFKAIM
jgi:hypothetical protein